MDENGILLFCVKAYFHADGTRRNLCCIPFELLCTDYHRTVLVHYNLCGNVYGFAVPEQADLRDGPERAYHAEYLSVPSV